MDDRGVHAFGRLSRGQAEKLAEAFDEGLLLHPPDLEMMRAITGPAFTDGDLLSLARLYADLLVAKISAPARRDVESGMGLDEDGRAILADVARKMGEAADEDKMRENLTLNDIKYSGHPHILRVKVYTEFRPYTSGESIRRLIPYIVVDGIVHGGGGLDTRPIRFQMDMESARRLLADLQSGIDDLGAEIKDMSEKFGEGAVLD